MSALQATDLIGVIGAGAMGSGIVQVALNAGHHVVLHDAAPAALDRGIASVADAYQRLQARARSTRPPASTAWAACSAARTWPTCRRRRW